MDNTVFTLDGKAIGFPSDKTDILSSAYYWDGGNQPSPHGTKDEPLPKGTGQYGQGYFSNPGFRVFYKGDVPGHLSYGPYYIPRGPGQITQLVIFCYADHFGGDDEVVATFDIVDYANGGKPIGGDPLVVRVGDLRTSKGHIGAFGIFLARPLTINQNMNIEARVFANGGSNLYFFNMHWTVTY